MRKNWIKNFNALATTENRELALQIVEAGYEAINTESAIFNFVKLENNILKIQNENFPLNNFKKIKIIGFGKSSGAATLALEKILGDRIAQGIVISSKKVDCQYIETYAGTHPQPSETNAKVGQKIYEMVKNSTEEDLIIVLVSGGGSALLCYPESEFSQGVRLYDEFLKCGQSRIQLNTVWKHLSLFKGGGLAKIAYPATVLGLIFSDLPGNHFENVASGATYFDKSTIADAQKIITENNLGKFDLLETPKEEKYFEKVHNFIVVSNETAITAMAKKTEELGLQTKIVSTELYDTVEKVAEKMFSAGENNSVALAAGEPSLEVKDKNGKGGRNLHLGLEALKTQPIGEDSVFISFASDGIDNSDSAGAIVDQNTLEKAQKLSLNPADYLNRFDSFSFFEKTGDLLSTGSTGANVSDLMILLTKK